MGGGRRILFVGRCGDPLPPGPQSLKAGSPSTDLRFFGPGRPAAAADPDRVGSGKAAGADGAGLVHNGVGAGARRAPAAVARYWPMTLPRHCSS
jgi:hypothetical protein